MEITDFLSIGLKNTVCSDFEDSILWTSGFTNTNRSSIKYQAWPISANCMQEEGICSLQDIKVDVRFTYLEPYNDTMERISYIQLSEPDESVCINPENGEYNIYLAYEKISNAEGQIRHWYCGKKQINESDSCLKLSQELHGNITCYGIKGYSSQGIIADVLKVRYKLCWHETNETAERQKK